MLLDVQSCERCPWSFGNDICKGFVKKCSIFALQCFLDFTTCSHALLLIVWKVWSWESGVPDHPIMWRSCMLVIGWTEAVGLGVSMIEAYMFIWLISLGVGVAVVLERSCQSFVYHVMDVFCYGLKWGLVVQCFFVWMLGIGCGWLLVVFGSGICSDVDWKVGVTWWVMCIGQ